MARFTVFAEQIKTGRQALFYYDNMTSQLCDESGQAVVVAPEFGVTQHDWENTPVAPAVAKDSPLGKTKAARRVKIQLGLNCNYDCSYCSQRASLAVASKVASSPEQIPAFVAGMEQWFDGGEDGLGAGVHFEFWGGEPLVYWKTLKPLAEAVHERYPQGQLLIISNGSLLDAEKVEWLDRMGFRVGLSHDGPGQSARGPDPLDDEQSRQGILLLLQRLAPQGRVSINSMIHRDNASRAALNAWMVQRFGEGVAIGEGGYIDPYDPGGLAQSMPDLAWARQHSKQAFLELRAGLVSNMQIAHQKVWDFIESVATQRPASVLGQKCGMDRAEHIAVDLQGNVLTCQNASAAGMAPNGESHAIGHVSQLDKARLNTATHWSRRPECNNCPVLQLCRGSCMFLEGELWEKGCDNCFADNIAFWAAGFEALTGYAPLYFDGPLRAERKDPFGFGAKVAGVAAATSAADADAGAELAADTSRYSGATGKVIPIRAVF